MEEETEDTVLVEQWNWMGRSLYSSWEYSSWTYVAQKMLLNNAEPADAPNPKIAALPILFATPPIASLNL